MHVQNPAAIILGEQRAGQYSFVPANGKLKLALSPACWSLYGILIRMPGAAQGESWDYNKVETSLLPFVLTHRRGIPISLAVIHAAVGRRAGLPIDCIGARRLFWLLRMFDLSFDAPGFCCLVTGFLHVGLPLLTFAALQAESFQHVAACADILLDQVCCIRSADMRADEC